MSVETTNIDHESDEEGDPNLMENENTPNLENENETKPKNVTLESFGFTSTIPSLNDTLIETNESSVEDNVSVNGTTTQGDIITPQDTTTPTNDPDITTIEDDETQFEETVHVKTGFCWINNRQFEKITKNIQNLSNNLDDVQNKKLFKNLKIALNSIIGDNTSKNALQKVLEPEKNELREVKKQNMHDQEQYKQQIQNRNNKITELYKTQNKLYQNITKYENTQLNLKNKQLQIQQIMWN